MGVNNCGGEHGEWTSATGGLRKSKGVFYMYMKNKCFWILLFI